MNSGITVPAVANQVVPEQTHFESVFGGHMAHDSALSTMLDPSGDATVDGLLGGGGPSAIAGSVWAIAVDAINRMARGWLRPHVAQKRGITRAPLIANGNPERAVLAKCFVVDGVAAGLHAAPAAIFRRVRRCVCAGPAMRALGTTRSFGMETPTASGVTANEIVPPHRFRFAAVAPTQPLRARFGRNKPFDNEAVESLPWSCLHLLIMAHKHVFYNTVK